MSELHSLAALRQAADHLRTEERHWWADTIMAAIETLAGEDSAAEAIERVRALHVRGDEWCAYHNSALCECANVYCEECRDAWPCPTIQALDGVGTEYRQEALPDLLAQAWDQGLRAEQRRQKPCLLHDVSGEDVPGWEMAECTCKDLTNPYRKEAENNE